MHRKWILSILVPLLVSFICLSTACKQAPEEKETVRPVKALQLKDPHSFVIRSFPGQAQAVQEVNLGFEVAGTILERPVDKGDRIHKGQVIAKLDPRDFKNQLAVAKAELKRATAYRDRIAEALRADAVAEQDLTDAQAQVSKAEAVVKIKQKALDDSVIRAPFEGVVAWTYKEKFQRVRAKELVLRVLDISSMEFNLDIPETMISHARRVKNIYLEFGAFPDKKYPAVIKEIGAEASARTRTFPVTLAFEQLPDVTVLPGMVGSTTGGKVKLTADLVEKGHVVPVAAVFTDVTDKLSYVWLIDDKTMKINKKKVTMGNLKPDGVVVFGLKAGQWIVIAGVHTLKAGQKVRVLTARQY